MILEKFRKKNNQIWSSYEGEIPIIIFNSRLKRKIWNHTSVLRYRLRYKNSIYKIERPFLNSVNRVRIPVTQCISFFLRITIRDTCINRAIPVIVITEGVA